MENVKKTSTFNNALIWFGAAVSIAEILTGTYFAGLGMTKGIIAIVAGHIVGALLMFLAGYIGAKEEKSSMETVKLSFGKKGSMIFSVLNILQLVGWTSIMIYDAALAANNIYNIGLWIYALTVGVLIFVWVVIDLQALVKINTVAMILLFILSIMLFKVIFIDNSNNAVTAAESISFIAAFELSVAMPLSWLPLISDYTSKAKDGVKASALSVIVYNIISIFMYIIGMGAAIYTGGGDIASIMVKAGMGIFALLIIVFSTVTTTFLDVYSAGISALALNEKLNAKSVAIVVTVIGTILASIYNMDNIMGFLYIIGSVFLPMISVQIADYFIIKNRAVDYDFDFVSLIVWFIGLVIYRLCMSFETPIGSTIPSLIITMILCVCLKLILRKHK